MLGALRPAPRFTTLPRMHRRSLLLLGAGLFSRAAWAQDNGAALVRVLDAAARLRPLKTVAVAHRGTLIAQRGYAKNTVGTPTNIKSASKSVISALVGIAIDKKMLSGADQKIAPLLEKDLPANPDPRLAQITIGNLLSMQAGLARTSGPNYGRWVASRNWVKAALAEPFVEEPGGPMLYSTGSSHLLSAILTRVSGRSTLELARDWLAPAEGFSIASWDRDPQGIYFGGNQMAMSTTSLLAFGELYRRAGKTAAGRQLIPADWIAQSWTARTASRFTGDAYGYGWFLREMAGFKVAYAWGYGGQMLYVAPDAELTCAMTSQDSAPAGRTGHRDDLHLLFAEILGAVVNRSR